jgi:P-type Ca2+ transporter type 2C
MNNFHAHGWQEIVSEFKSDIEQGLNSAEVKVRAGKFGLNVLTQSKKIGPLQIFVNQFKSSFVLLLLLAAGLSVYFGEILDAIAIAAVIIINAVIGFIMEFRAEKSMEALKKLTVVTTKVMRDGIMQELPSEQIVPGDILFLEAGDIISADARLISVSQLATDESSLTGESIPVDKQIHALPEQSQLAERTNMIYKGTHVTKGNGLGIVVSTGMQTELGHIARLVQTADAAETPIEKKIEEFSKKLIKLTILIIIVIFVLGAINGKDLVLMIQTSIALAVAAIPEGLPIVATLALAQGVMRMAQHQVIVKRLAAVETLGGTTVICTDKTGTLTENKIEVNHIHTLTEEIVFKPNPVKQELNVSSGNHLLQTENFEYVKMISCLCNTAEIKIEDQKVTEIGDPLETGLLKFVAAGGMDIASMRKAYPKVKEIPFNSDERIMATCHQNKNDFISCVKGATEELLRKCTKHLAGSLISELNQDTKKDYLLVSERMAESGLRVIGMAYKKNTALPEEISSDLVFVGLIGMIDPSRAEVPQAINECEMAGIKVVMVTGDHPATAKNIGLQLGLLKSVNESAVHGHEMGEFEELNEPKEKIWESTRIFARLSPKQKLDLVKFYQQKKEVVAMTGDGINDAPALKKADIGIAMGIRGTQVAQEVADIILKDDSFTSILVAVKQGRIIYQNIRRFIIFLLSCNLSELIIIATTTILNFHFALLPLQILYLNLVTDVLPALALGVTEGSENVMKEKPRDPSEPILTRVQWKALIVYSFVIGLAVIAAVSYTHEVEHIRYGEDHCNNVLFLTLIFSQLFHVFNITTDKSFFGSDVFRNKNNWYALLICSVLTIGAFFIAPVASVLRLDHLSTTAWLTVFGFSILATAINWFIRKFRIV